VSLCTHARPTLSSVPSSSPSGERKVAEPVRTASQLKPDEEVWSVVSHTTPPATLRLSGYLRDRGVELKGRPFGPGKGKSKVPSGAISLPPPIQVVPRFSHRYRFRATAAANSLAVSLQDLLGAVGVVGAVVNSKVNTLSSTVRLRSITVWPSASTSGPDHAYVYWSPTGLAGYVPDELWETAIPDGITVARALRFVPPSGSLASFWLNPDSIPSTTGVFVITAASGSIIDVDAELTLPVTGISSQITVATAVVGEFYWLALDGAASNVLVPLGFPTTH